MLDKANNDNLNRLVSIANINSMERSQIFMVFIILKALKLVHTLMTLFYEVTFRC